MLCLKIAGWMANSVDPDEAQYSAASPLGLHCLLRPVCRNTYEKYGMQHSKICLSPTDWKVAYFSSFFLLLVFWKSCRFLCLCLQTLFWTLHVNHWVDLHWYIIGVEIQCRTSSAAIVTSALTLCLLGNFACFFFFFFFCHLWIFFKN